MTGNKMRVALIPAYEPEPRLIGLLEKLQERGMAVVVVDDGSGPSFSDIFKRASKHAVVLSHPENRGKGCALKTGLQFIKSHFAIPYTVVTMDADGQHQVDDAIHVCEAAERNTNALILGSRRLQENVPLKSRLGNTITRFVYVRTTGLHVHDTQTGLRAFSCKLLPTLLDIPGERYEYEMNVLLEFANRNIAMKEIEIATIYIDGNSGSHFDPFKDSCRIYKELLKYSTSSLACFLLDYLLYSLLAVWTAGFGGMSLTISNVTARIISASVNFTFNRKLVFRSEKNVWRSAVQYFALAAAILAGNTLVLAFLVKRCGVNPFAAKLLTEIIFFAISWMIQHFIIFRRKEVLQ